MQIDLAQMFLNGVAQGFVVLADAIIRVVRFDPWLIAVFVGIAILGAVTRPQRRTRRHR